jgi:phosphohistidine swiveling domain-containing protein
MKNALLFLVTLQFTTMATQARSASYTWPSGSPSRGFEENIGQVSGSDAQRVKFRLDDGALTVFLLDNAIAYQFIKPEEAAVPMTLPGALPTPRAYATHRMDMQLIGADAQARISTYEPLGHYNRYAQADMRVAHSYRKVVYHDIYPGIDWVFHINAAGVKHEFIVHPGGDPHAIVFEARWADAIGMDPEGNLLLSSRLGTVTEEHPVSFQGDRRIATRFVVEGHRVSYTLDAYDRTQPLVIDPQLIWGSYYGGEGTDGIASVTTDSQGNVYFCGGTASFTGIAEGGFLNTNPLSGGTSSAFLVKFTPDGDRIWGTYYGGGGSTGASACAVDSEDNVYIAGSTSDNSGIAANGFQNSLNDQFVLDGYLAKFDPSGQRIWGTYFGGNGDDGFACLTIDANDNIFAAGITTSTNLPVLNAFQSTLNPDIGFFSSDGFYAKFDVSCNLLACSYLGGPGQNSIFGIAHNASGDIFVCGRTTSSSFPVLNAHQSTSGNTSGNPVSFDAFLTKINANGSLGWSTYYGGDESDAGYSCAVDALGNVYLAGNAGSQNNIASGGFQNSIALGSASFLAKFNAAGVRQWGTYYGFSENGWSSNQNIGFGCATDQQNNVYLVGRTSAQSNVAFQGFQNSLSGDFTTDGFIVKFNTTGQRLWGSYYGGDGVDGLRGCHVDPSDQLYVVGQTNSSNNIFFQGFQSTVQLGTGYIAKIGCPSPRLVDLPAELCANATLQLAPFPVGGTLQLLGAGSLNGTNYTAPNVASPTAVSFQYSISATNFCPSDAQQFTLTVLPNTTATVAIAASSAVVCEGDSITFTADIVNAGTAPQVQWLVNNVVVQEGAATFAGNGFANGDVVQCVVTGNNPCALPSVVTSNTVAVTVNANPGVSLVFASVFGGTLFATSGLAGYAWFLDGVLIDGATSDSYIPTANGVYTVVGTNAAGCTGEASVQVITLGVPTLDAMDVSVFPNPSNGQFTITAAERGNRHIQLFDASGQLVHEQFSTVRVTTVAVAGLSTGVYLLRVSMDGRSGTQRLVVTQE